MTQDVQTAVILEEVFEERRRQREVKGYTAAHDRQHDEGELAMAAAAFAVQSTGDGTGADILWPFPTLMPAYATRRHRLIVAAALIVAEIERIDGERLATAGVYIDPRLVSVPRDIVMRASEVASVFPLHDPNEKRCSEPSDA